MMYTEFAKLKFREILDGSPANACEVYAHENGVTVDGGVKANGGWMATRTLLEGLVGGRGQINYSERMVDGMQLPTVDLYLDDPVESARNFIPDDNGVMGVKGENGYALGVAVTDYLTPYLPGNMVLLRCGSLADQHFLTVLVFQTGMEEPLRFLTCGRFFDWLSTAVDLLDESGVDHLVEIAPDRDDGDIEFFCQLGDFHRTLLLQKLQDFLLTFFP